MYLYIYIYISRSAISRKCKIQTTATGEDAEKLPLHSGELGPWVSPAFCGSNRCTAREVSASF